MSSDWIPVHLSDLVEVRHGWPFKSEFFATDVGSSSLPIVVAIGNFDYGGGFRFGSTLIKRYTDRFPPEYSLEVGDILLVMTCQTAGGEILGVPARVPGDGRTYLHNQRLGKVVSKGGRVSQEFLYWLFLHRDFNRHLVNSATGTKILHTAPKRIESFKFRLPPLWEQKAIAAVLSSLDNRIARLRETNATLEAIVQALFKSWFVDFDPVRAKLQGSAPSGMDETTAAFFPESFEESALGLVPTGWREGKVSDFAQMHRRSVNPGDTGDTLFEHFSLPAFDAGQMPVRELGSEIKSNKTSVPRDAVLLSKLNPHIPRVWLPVEAGLNAVCSTEFLVFVPVAGASREFAYCAFVAAPFQERLRQLTTGTSNSHQRVKLEDVLSLTTVVPPSLVIEAFTSVARPIFERVGHNRRQAQTLVALRDTVLPRLISGQLRLPEARAELEEAT